MHDVTNQEPPVLADIPRIDTERTVVDVIHDRIRNVDQYHERDLSRPHGMKSRDWRLAIHEAEQRMLADGVVFQPVPGRPGYRRRATKPSQAEGRSKRFAAAARRKMGRATQLVAAARGLTEDPMEQQRLERLELRRQNAMVDSLAAMRGAGEKRPKGV